MLLRIEAERPDEVVIDVGRVKVSAAVVESDDLLKGRKMPVMKVRPAQTDVA